jgi:hypothetical protein
MNAIRQHITPLGYSVRETSLLGARIYGGYFIWLSPSEGVSLNSELIAEVATEEENLAIGYGGMFEVHGDEASARFSGDIRICFAWEVEEAIAEGIQRLGALLERMLEHKTYYETKKPKNRGEFDFVTCYK